MIEHFRENFHIQNREKVGYLDFFEKCPRLRSDGKMNVMLSYCIHGAQMSNPDVPFETVLKTPEDILEALQPLMKEKSVVVLLDRSMD